MFKVISGNFLRSQSPISWPFRSKSKNTLRRLAEHRKAKLAPLLAAASRLNPSSSKNNDRTGPRQNFDYFLILDFEATCDNKDPKFGPIEIIEFPVLKVCSRTFLVESAFHTYVRPTINPVLRPFCTQLTGMVQDDVSEEKPTISQTLEAFDLWMRRENLLSEEDTAVDDAEKIRPNFAWVTCGDLDLGQMLPAECARLGLATPSYTRAWINVKVAYSHAYGKWARGLKHMLDELKLPHVGRHHSGIDDCENVLRILEAVAVRKQLVYSITSTYTENDEVSSHFKKMM